MTSNTTISILGSGWLGLPLSQALADIGYNIKLSTRSQTKHAQIKSSKCIPYLVDIEQQPIDSDFLSADILIINITSKNYAAFNLLIKEIEKSAIKHVLFISSTSVYKNTQSWVTESSHSELPENKLFQIEQLFSANNRFNTTILRLSGLIGYQRHPGRFFKQGKLVPSPDAPVNLIHRDDCIAIIKAIIEQCVWGEIFNACADNHPSKKQFYSHARSLLGQEAPSFSDSGESHYKIVSNDKIKQQLNYQFIYPDFKAGYGPLL
jgi:nucleoside-diphosphate-sugar epimerase